ncbi:MAG: Lrp/AsnC family transcriptional regulator [Candidatus Woesearchaeota archaeon]
MYKLDKLDKKLLFELEQDSRQTLSTIAKKLKTSQQVISYRLSQLEKQEVITEYFTLINIASLGYSSYRTMIRLGNTEDETYTQFIEYLKQDNNILWIVECGGKWDIIINYLASNPVKYQRFLEDLRTKFKDIILDNDLLLTIDGIYFGRDYLNEKQRPLKNRAYFGGEYKIAKLDDVDLKILSTISQNSRLSALEIAEKMRLSANTIIARIKELKKIGVIQGFAALVHLEKINYQAYKALIKLKPLTHIEESKLLTYLSMNNNIIGVLRLIGEWNFEIEFEVQTREEMLKISRDIRAKFKEHIDMFEVLPLYNEYRYNYFPENLIEKE